VSEPLDAIVIGGGQAGLSMSHYLSRGNVTHLVLERARVGERWRTERWDSLRFQFPAHYVRLPDFDYDGEDPDAFLTREDIVRVLERYAQHINAPLRCGVNVVSLDRDDDGIFTVNLGHDQLRARSVVLATGPYQSAVVPAISMQLPTRVTQLTANTYTNESALPAGAVLVVGAGGSGVQIAEDLLAAGRDTYLCVGQHRRIPRRYRGQDVMHWFEVLGLATSPPLPPDQRPPSPLLTGVGGGYDVDLRNLAQRGGKLLGRLEDVSGEELVLGDGLLEDIAAGDAAYVHFRSLVDDYVASNNHGEHESVNAGHAHIEKFPPMPPDPPTRLNILDENISAVIWATGYGLDFSWVKCGARDTSGAPEHTRGVCEVPGLFLLGLPFLHSARSSFFWGVGEDARYLSQRLKQWVSGQH